MLKRVGNEYNEDGGGKYKTALVFAAYGMDGKKVMETKLLIIQDLCCSRTALVKVWGYNKEGEIFS